MADTKHYAEVLADTLERRQFLRSPSPEQIGEMLRRIPALEAELGVLLSAVEEWRKLADQQAGKLTALEAERDQLRAEVEALRTAVLVGREACARICDTTPPQPFRPSIEAAHAIRSRNNHAA